jgi:hypothetical protein
MALAPGAEFTLTSTHVISQVQIYDRLGSTTGTIDTLYKAGTWASLGACPSRSATRALIV